MTSCVFGTICGVAGRPGVGPQRGQPREYVMETGLVADLSIVKAWKADAQGNLIFNKTARNFNPDMATAGKFCVAEVEEIVPVGSINPDHIHLPGIFVNRVVQGKFEKRIEQRTVRKRS